LNQGPTGNAGNRQSKASETDNKKRRVDDEKFGSMSYIALLRMVLSSYSTAEVIKIPQTSHSTSGQCLVVWEKWEKY